MFLSVREPLNTKMIKHVLLLLIVTGGFFTVTGFVLTMFGFSSPCNEPPHCNSANDQRTTMYKVYGPVLLTLGILVVGVGVKLKWRLESKHLQLENRVYSNEGTNFTGDTNLDVSRSPVEETPSGGFLLPYPPDTTTTGMKLGPSESGFLADGTDYGGSRYLASSREESKEYFSRTPWPVGASSEHPPPEYQEYSNYPTIGYLATSNTEDDGLDVVDTLPTTSSPID